MSWLDGVLTAFYWYGHKEYIALDAFCSSLKHSQILEIEWPRNTVSMIEIEDGISLDENHTSTIFNEVSSAQWTRTFIPANLLGSIDDVQKYKKHGSSTYQFNSL